MSFGQPSSFAVLGNNQNAPSAFGRSASVSAPAAPSGPPEVVIGDEPQETESDVLGYLALGGDDKVKVFEGEFSEANLPIPSAQLLSVSQKKQLFAVGGPQGVVVSRTATLRQAFLNKTAAANSVIPFQPECTLALPGVKLSHVSFTADGTFLLLGAQVGGIAVYSVDDILNRSNQAQPLHQIATDPLIEMRVNPDPEHAHLVCILTGKGWGQGGSVSLVDVKAKTVGKELKSSVTTVCWSPKGKQLVCGGDGGGIAWLQPSGKEVGVVPGVPELNSHFISSIYWIENNIFFVIVTRKPAVGSTSFDNESIHFILTREGNKHIFSKINDMSPPFGMTTRPTYHSFIHLKAWAPSLKDAIIISNTPSTDIGTILRMDNSTFTPTSIISDGRRAAMPMGLELGIDTTPIGLALDLTAPDSERINNPIDNFEKSITSHPCMLILTNDGRIAAYWVVYSEAVKMGNTNGAYPGLIAYESQQPPQTPQRATAPAFGQSAFGSQPTTSPFGAQTSPFGTAQSVQPAPFGSQIKPLAFGQTSAPVSAFGQPAKPAAFGQPAFGQPSAPQSSFGQTSAPQSAFGQPSFGAPSTMGRPGFGAPTSAFGTKPAAPAFGSTSALGSAAPAFGSTSALGSAAPAFGSTSALGSRPQFCQSSFGSTATPVTGFGQTSQLGSSRPGFGSAAPASGGFAKFSSAGGFGATPASNAPAAFLQSSGSSNAFASPQADTFSNLKTAAPSTSAFGAPAGGFKMTSAFGAASTPDTTAGASKQAGAGAFGSAFGSTLGTALSQPTDSTNVKDDEMKDSEDEEEQPRQGLRGGTMFNLGSSLSGGASAAAGKDTPKPLAPAFGQIANDKPADAKPSVFGTGLFGSALNKDAGEKPSPTVGSAFGTTAPKPTLGSAFGAPAAGPSENQVGKGLFGSALQKSTSTSGPSLFGTTSPGATTAPAFGKPSPLVSAFTQPTATGAASTSAFGPRPGDVSPTKPEPSKPVSAFSQTGPAGAVQTKSPFSAFGAKTDQSSNTQPPTTPKAQTPSVFGQKQAPLASAERSLPKDATAAAASQGLPDDDSDKETVHSPTEAEEAALPPDFTAGKSVKAGWGSGAMALPNAASTKKTPTIASDEAPLPPDFASEKSAKTGWGSSKIPLPTAKSSTRSPSPSKEIPSEAALPPDFTAGRTAAAGWGAGNMSLPPLGQSASQNLKGQAEPSSIKEAAKHSPLTGQPAKPKAVNPLTAMRSGSGRPSSSFLSSSRTPPQKPGAARSSKVDLNTNATSNFSFFNNSEAKHSNQVDFTTSASKSEKFDFHNGFNPKIEDDSDDEDDEDDDDDDGGENGEEEGSDVHDEDGVGEDEVEYDSGEEDEDDEVEGDEDEEDDDEEPGSSEVDEDNSWVHADKSSPVEQPSRNNLFDRMGPANAATKGRARPNVKSVPPRANNVPQTIRPTPASRPPISKIVGSGSQLANKEPASQQDQPALSAARLSGQNLEVQRAAEEERRAREEKSRLDVEARERERMRKEREMHMKEIEKQKAIIVAQIHEKEKIMVDGEAQYRQMLQRPFDPSAELRPFVTYKDGPPFTNFKETDGLMEQFVISLERRIDNLAVNMRNVESFISQNKASDHFTLDDKRSAESICITAAPDISLMAKDLIERTQDFSQNFDKNGQKESVTLLINDIDYLVSRGSDIPNLVLLHTHPNLRAHVWGRPLSSQQRIQQANLRRNVPLLRRRLKRAEDLYRVLQARLATINKHQKASYGDIRPPTIEQVRETITKLGDVAREKSDRVDAIEDAVRKMRIRSASPALSRGTTPSFSRAGSVGFSVSGRSGRERGSTPTATPFRASTRPSRDAGLATPPSRMPGPDSLDYYEATVDNPISRYSGKTPKKLSQKPVPGSFGLIEEEDLAENEYFHDQHASSPVKIPIASSYDKQMADRRKEVLTTPKKGDGNSEVPATPASRQINKVLKEDVEDITGVKRGTKVWGGLEDYSEDRKIKKEVGQRALKVARRIGVRTITVQT